MSWGKPYRQNGGIAGAWMSCGVCFSEVDL
jgi:hypothetical protein